MKIEEISIESRDYPKQLVVLVEAKLDNKNNPIR